MSDNEAMSQAPHDGGSREQQQSDGSVPMEMDNDDREIRGDAASPGATRGEGSEEQRSDSPSRNGLDRSYQGVRMNVDANRLDGVAGQINLHVVFLVDPSIVGGESGEMDNQLRELYRRMQQWFSGGDNDAKPKGVSQSTLDELTVSKGETRQGESCAICMQDYECDTEVAELECKHAFCKSCVSKWLAMQNSCPLCREKVEESASAKVEKHQEYAHLDEMPQERQTEESGSIREVPFSH
mmetsp:Transcript_9339/g.16383  ORF Transcript_9339/g.16383 Transcript_9339/m.16383 type:complete len:240 (+) Transcript_9339:1833-2552(+)